MPQNRNQTTATAQAGSANAIALSQSLAGAGPVTLNGALASGGIATLGSPGPQQNVLIHSVGNDSGITFTISGLDYGGSAISEVLTGGSGATVTSALLYSQVNSIVASGATAAAITAGTGASIYSPWLIQGAQRNHEQTTVRTFIGATNNPESANYDIQATSDINIMNQVGGYADDIDTVESGLTGNATSYMTSPWMAYRIVVHSGGPVTLRLLESRTA